MSPKDVTRPNSDEVLGTASDGTLIFAPVVDPKTVDKAALMNAIRAARAQSSKERQAS